MFQVKIDDSQIKRFIKTSPKRAEWSLKEALAMAGGHYRGVLKSNVMHGRFGGPAKIHPLTAAGQNRHRSPLYNMAKYGLISFRVSSSKAIGGLRLWIGFLSQKNRRINVGGGKKVTIPALAKIHEQGKRIRVTPQMRKMAAAKGLPLKKSTKFLQIPARPVIAPFWQKIKGQIPKYIERRFFQKFFSKENSRLKI